MTLHSPGDIQAGLAHGLGTQEISEKTCCPGNRHLLAWGSLQEAKTKAGWEGAFWLSPFLSSLAVPVDKSLPGWPGLLHAGVPQAGDLVLGGDFPYAAAPCFSPVSP